MDIAAKMTPVSCRPFNITLQTSFPSCTFNQCVIYKERNIKIMANESRKVTTIYLVELALVYMTRQQGKGQRVIMQ